MGFRIKWPFRIERKSLASPDAQLLELFGASINTAAGVPVTVETALRVPAVACAIRVVSEAAATLPAHVTLKGQPTPDHPAQALLTGDWNGWTSAYDGVLALVVDALTRDEGGIAWVNRVGEGRPVEIIRYTPGLIKVEQADTGEPAYKLGQRPLNPADVIHLRSFGPIFKCPLTVAREAIGLAMTMERHAGRLFGNGARPSGMLSLKGTVNPDTVAKIREAWLLAHGGEKSGGTAVVGSDATFTSLAMTSVDAQFAELLTFLIQQIARAFRVPPHMLFDLGRATWSNSEQMGLEFLSYTLQPWLDAIKGALRRALFTPEERKQGYSIEFDTDDLTRADIGARAQAYSSLISSRVINPNEARRWEGMPPYAGGEAFLNPNVQGAPGGSA